MTNKRKTLIVILSVALAGLILFFTIKWGFIENAINGAQSYTYADVTAAYDDGYSKGAASLKSYQERITELMTEVEQKKAEASKVPGLESANAELTALVAQLNQTIESYQLALENGGVDIKIVRFYLGDDLIDVQFVSEADEIEFPTLETTQDFIFKGWTIDGTTIINESAFVLTDHTNFIASATYWRIQKYNEVIVSNVSEESSFYIELENYNYSAGVETKFVFNIITYNPTSLNVFIYSFNIEMKLNVRYYPFDKTYGDTLLLMENNLFKMSVRYPASGAILYLELIEIQQYY